ncbi:hypothetical protein VC88_12105 [Geobacillus sp. A8]|nr:hypothetical protein VC88_12105 [Geobacillus sp. A8]
MTFAFFYRASLGGPDERREQKFATLVGESFRNVTHKYFTHTRLLMLKNDLYVFRRMAKTPFCSAIVDGDFAFFAGFHP